MIKCKLLWRQVAGQVTLYWNSFINPSNSPTGLGELCIKRDRPRDKYFMSKPGKSAHSCPYGSQPVSESDCLFATNYMKRFFSSADIYRNQVDGSYPNNYWAAGSYIPAVVFDFQSGSYDNKASGCTSNLNNLFSGETAYYNTLNNPSNSDEDFQFVKTVVQVHHLSTLSTLCRTHMLR